MVNDLLNVAPRFHHVFNKIIPTNHQKVILDHSFAIGKKAWEAHVADFPNIKKVKGGKKYFETQRNYQYMVPMFYKRTKAPRLTATGNTFHGMKKDMAQMTLKHCIKHFKHNNQKFSILDLDMGAAHARVAIALQKDDKSELYRSVVASGSFWDEKAQLYHRKFVDAGVAIEKPQVRAMLKVVLYSSLNGGSPLGKELLFDNITLNHPILTKPFFNADHFETSDLYNCFRHVLSDFSLIKEVGALNAHCAIKMGEEDYITFTLDRESAYQFNSSHKGISRALQSFEVVLLTVLVQKIIQSGGMPLNLAHDGVMAIYPGIIKPEVLTEHLTQEMDPWARFMLNGLNLPIDCKFSLNEVSLANELEMLPELEF